MESIYTKSERTDRKYTVGRAVKLAEWKLEQRARGRGTPAVCITALQGRPLSHKLTLEEVNLLADEIAQDSWYHNSN